MAYCPAYLGHICSLCCSLDARCNDMCKPHASWSAQWQAAARKLLPSVMWHKLDTELGRYLLSMCAVLPLLGMLFYMIYEHQHKSIIHCTAVKMDGQGKKMSEPADLDTTQIGFAANNKIYTTVTSENRQRIMVCKINSKNPKNFLFTTFLFNDHLELLDRHRIYMPILNWAQHSRRTTRDWKTCAGMFLA